MFTPVNPVLRGCRLASPLIALVLVVCACAPAATPSVTQAGPSTPAMTPSQTPSADEAIEGFLAFASGDEQPMHVEWEGKVATADSVLMTVSAQLDDAGPAERLRSTYMREDTTRKTEYVHAPSGSYERGRDGIWWSTEGGGFGLGELLEKAVEVTAAADPDAAPGAGWVLTAAPVKLPQASVNDFFSFGVANGDVSATTTEFTVRVDAAGIPLSAHVTADVVIDVGTKVSKAVADYTWEFSDIGRKIDVVAPTEAWRRYLLPSAYTVIRYPASWTHVAGDDGGYITSPAGLAAFAFVALTNATGDLRKVLEGYDSELGQTPLERGDIVIDGVPGFVTSYKRDASGKQTTEFSAAVVVPGPKPDWRRLQVVSIYVPDNILETARPEIDRLFENVTILDPISALPEGTCYVEADMTLPEHVQVVACEELHDGEIHEAVALAGTAAPEGAARDAIHAQCLAAFEEHVGIAADESALRNRTFGPDPEEWDAGIRTAVCVVTDPMADGTTGSLVGARR